MRFNPPNLASFTRSTLTRRSISICVLLVSSSDVYPFLYSFLNPFLYPFSYPFLYPFSYPFRFPFRFPFLLSFRFPFLLSFRRFSG